MKALILAAGYATRLYPLTRDYPKPLLKVGGRPIIDYIVDKLQTPQEIDEIIVVTNSKFIGHFRKWKKARKPGKKISLVDDETKSLSDRLGAIGDINFAIEKKGIGDDLLVVGGDNLFDGDLRYFLSFARARRKNPAIGVFDIKTRAHAVKYGVIKVDAKNRIIDFKEKPKNPASSLVAMCLYYLPKEKLGLIREYLGKKDKKTDATGSYIDWLRKQYPVYAFVFSGRWYDIGDHKFYKEARKNFNTRITPGHISTPPYRTLA